MNYSKDISPVGWYVATYQLRFIERAAKGNNDRRRKFTVWENTVLVKAKSLADAFRKVVKVGRGFTRPYKGGPNAVDVQWVFEGVVQLLPVYEKIEDGSEIMWGERIRTLKTIRQSARKLSDFKTKPRPIRHSSRMRTKRRAS